MDVTNMQWGPDVSHYRPVRDWGKLAGSGATFFGAKSTEGVHTIDDFFAEHRDGFRQHCQGFEMAVWYHFFHAEKDPRDQADRFAEVVGQLQPRERLCCDFEGKSYSSLAPSVVQMHGLEFLDAFYARLEEVGAFGESRPLIYTSARHWQAIGDPLWERANHIDLWVPRYHLPDPQAPTTLPRPWASWAVLQYTDGNEGVHREVPGVGLCDCNVIAEPSQCSADHPENG